MYILPMTVKLNNQLQIVIEIGRPSKAWLTDSKIKLKILANLYEIIQSLHLFKFRIMHVPFKA